MLGRFPAEQAPSPTMPQIIALEGHALDTEGGKKNTGKQELQNSHFRTESTLTECPSVRTDLRTKRVTAAGSDICLAGYSLQSLCVDSSMMSTSALWGPSCQPTGQRKKQRPRQ